MFRSSLAFVLLLQALNVQRLISASVNMFIKLEHFWSLLFAKTLIQAISLIIFIFISENLVSLGEIY